MLDAELLAHKNIFEAPPRISRQARRKAMRAERKAARRTATERFLVGAPSLSEAAGQFSVAAMPEEIVVEPSAADVELAEGDTLVMACSPTPAVDGDDVADDEISEEPVPLETIAEMISATGPLVLPTYEAALEEAVQEAEAHPDVAPLPLPRRHEASLGATAHPVDEPAPAELIGEIAIEQMTMPLPRNRALVPAKRSWLMRLIPWRGRRNVPAPEPALMQLQELRFELAMTLRRLDQIIDTLPERATTH
ncbi:MAG: hypothetical protein J7485_12985 [Sphingobium sp.]|nr:hypothetical protein [Sphingobium sp.]